MKSFVKVLVGIVVVGAMAGFVISNWSWVFAKKIHGKILDVQRVTNPNAIITSRASDAQIHSFAVLIQGDDNVLYTASSEDHQWQVAQKGYCVSALLYRYPPWDFERANTYFNARLEQLEICKGESAPPQAAPAAAPDLSAAPADVSASQPLTHPEPNKDQTPTHGP